jgi:transcriptional regulator with XRE-family HTH domain
VTGRELGPIRAARMLRADLRRAREIAGITQADVGLRLGWSTSKVARIESGEVGISDADLLELGATLGLGEAVCRELVRRNQAARVRGWWHEFRNDLSPALATLVGLEAEVDRISEYATDFVPCLLQTPAYAEAAIAMTSGLPNGTQRDVRDAGPRNLLGEEDARLVALRLRRQSNVFDQADPPELTAVIDESVLYRPIGGPATMAAQVRRLAELARRPHIEIRVVPFESTVYRRNGFLMVEDETAAPLMYTELFDQDLLVQYRARTPYFAQHFTDLRDAALDPARTGQLLHRVAEAYEAGDQPRPWLWS